MTNYETAVTIITGCVAFYGILAGFVMKTQNVFSSMIFKFIPFVLGAASLWICLKTIGAI